jgi:hypothetical protein
MGSAMLFVQALMASFVQNKSWIWNNSNQVIDYLVRK